jgi:hypothetical protein
MSDLTKFIRANIPGGGALLNAVEGVEGAATDAVVQTVVGVAKPLATVAVQDLGAAVSNIVTSAITKSLGAGATIPEDVANYALQEIENWVLSKL